MSMTHTPNSFKPLTVSKASAGSGKTFTLAAYYVALLMSGESFRHILAVTFTNKATEEMKSRILANLYAISLGHPDYNTLLFIEKVQGIMESLGAAPLSADEMQEPAGRLYREILAEYDEMRVLTIDSFLQTLYGAMAQALGMPSALSVELDTDHVITTAVDDVLSGKMLTKPGLADLVGRYIQSNLDNKDTADIRKSLIKMAKEIFKESVQAQGCKIVYDPAKLDSFRTAVTADWTSDPACVAARASLAVLAGLGGVSGKFTRPASDKFRSFVGNYEKSFAGTVKDADAFVSDPVDGFLGSIGDMGFNTKKITPADQAVFYSELKELNRLRPLCRKAYLYSVLTTDNLHDVGLLSYIRELIDDSLTEANSKLLATAASELSRMLRASVGADADEADPHGTYDGSFLLEKAGIRYHHIMLDEFQDTSNLQWANFLSLIFDVLNASEEGCLPHTCFIVGDIKQAIYRFRNGDWHIMESLTEEHPVLGPFYNTADTGLRRSFRSRYEVVKFNVGICRQIAEDEDSRIKASDWYTSGAARSNIRFAEIYKDEWSEDVKNKYYVTAADAEADARRHGFFEEGKEYGHEGGYVRCRFYPMLGSSKDHLPYEQQLEEKALTDRILEDMFLQIDAMLERNPDYARDILILVRKNTQEKPVMKKFREMQKLYPALRATNIVTESSYRLDASRSVLTVIAALRYFVYADQVGGKMVRTVLGNRAGEVWPVVKALDRRMPLADLVEEVVRLCLCDEEGRFAADDVAYINCFTDRLHEFIARYGSDPEAFLTFWEDKLHKESVAIADTGLIRTLTLHKSKGLEAKTLFIPFCDWDLEAVPQNSTGKIWCEVRELTDDDGRPAILPIDDKPLAAEGGFAQEYRDEHESRRLDNINLLYVGLTRAADNLYVYGKLKPELKWTASHTFGNLESVDLSVVPADTAAGVMINAEHLGACFNQLFIDYLTAESDKAEKAAADDEPDDDTLAHAACCFVEILRGDGPLVPPQKEKKDNGVGEAETAKEAAKGEPAADPKPFSFKDRPMIGVDLCRTNDNIEFQQSQQSQLYARFPEEVGRRIEESIRFGNICHDIMARVEVHSPERDDLPRVVDDFCAAGIIESETMLKAVHERICEMWECPEMADWFSGRWRLLLEEPLLAFDGKGHAPENRMDRVMIDDASSTAVVLDYKFGADLGDKAMRHYEEQVRGYMNLLTRMGYQHVSGYLWLAEAAQHLRPVQL